MEASAVGFGLAEFFLLLFSGQFLGLVPGERDPALIKSPPAAAYFYQEWTAPGPLTPGAPGVAGLLADPEIEAFVTAVTTAVGAPESTHDESTGEIQATARKELLTLLRLTALHAGCLYVSGDVSGAEPAPMMIPLEGALVLNLGADVDEFLASANRLLKHLPGYEPNDNPQDHPIPVSLIPVKLHREESTVILAVGSESLPRLLARRAKPAAELPKLAMFDAEWRAAATPQPGRIAWVNLTSLREELPVKFEGVGMVARSVMAALGLENVNSVLSVSGNDGDDSLIKTRLALGDQQSGLLRLLGGRALMKADFSDIPGDADFVTAISLDLGRVQGTAREIVQHSAPDAVGAFDEFIRQLGQELQLSADDVTASFGDIITAYDAPSTGGMAVAGLVVAIPVKDAQRAAAVVERMRQLIVEGLPPSIDDAQSTLVELNFQGETIHYLDSRGYAVRYNGDPPWSPAICLTKRSLFIALHPQAIKGHLRFAASKQPRFDAGALLPDKGELIAAMMVDTPRIAQAVWPLLPYLMKAEFAEGQANGMSLKLGDLPSASAVLPYLRPGSLSVVRHQNLVVVEQRNLLPIVMAAAFLPRFMHSHGDMMLEDHEMPLEGRNAAPAAAPVVNLGVGTGVQQAKAEQPAPEPKRELTAVERAALKTLPVAIKSALPVEVQQFVPDVLLQKLAEETTPERIEQRRIEREQRKADRAAKRAARRVIVP